MLALLVLAVSSGVLIVLGCLVLLYQQKIFIDRETNEIVEIVTPVLQLKTHLPVLALFGLGAVLIALPVWWQLHNPGDLAIQGEVRSTGPVHTDVFAVIGQGEVRGGPGTHRFVVTVPSVGRPYTLLYITRSGAVDIRPVGESGWGSRGPVTVDSEDVVPNDRYVAERGGH